MPIQMTDKLATQMTDAAHKLGWNIKKGTGWWVFSKQTDDVSIFYRGTSRLYLRIDLRDLQGSFRQWTPNWTHEETQKLVGELWEILIQDELHRVTTLKTVIQEHCWTVTDHGAHWYLCHADNGESTTILRVEYDSIAHDLNEAAEVARTANVVSAKLIQELADAITNSEKE